MAKKDWSEYENENIILDSGMSSLYINKIGKDYVILESVCDRESDGKPEIEMKINFDMEDDADVKLRNEIKKVYNWHINHCKNCKTGKDKPAISYELELYASLKELIES